VKAEDFAVLLGLQQSVTLPGLNFKNDENERQQILMFFIGRNSKESQPQQDIILSQFCALHLPQLVSRYLDPPPLQDVTDEEFTKHYPLHNAHLDMMVIIQHIPYFTKYLHSSKPLAAPGKRLPSVLAKRLLDFAPHLDLRMRSPAQNRPTDFYQNIARCCVALLCNLLVIFIKVPDQNLVIDAGVRQGLLLWLRKWDQRYSSARSDDPVLGEWCATICSQLCPDIYAKHEAKLVRRRFKNLSKCALPGCTVKDNCKICAKCKTVSYCSVEHQRAHWKSPIGAPHKELCHETQY